MEHDDIESAIDREAAGWVIRADKGPLSPAEQQHLDAWLNADVRHHGAFIRAQAAFDLTAQISIESLGDIPGLNLYPEPHVAGLSRRRALFVGGAGMSAAAALALYVNLESRSVTYRTVRGEIRTLPLEDGSSVTLNTESEILVSFKRTTREITLVRGEALFDVAKDKQRPFTVTVGNTVTRAVGTSFAIRNLENQPIELLVREGAVEMFRQSSNRERPLLVNAYSRAITSEIPFPTVKLVDTALDDAAIARFLAWRQGMISFQGESLKKAADEFNRYGEVQILVEDPQVAGKTVTGLFSVNNPVGFARTVAISLDLKIEVSANKVMLWK